MTRSPGLTIPDDKTKFASDSQTVAGSGITKIEHVAVQVEITHADPSELELRVQSPSGTWSRLTHEHPLFPSDENKNPKPIPNIKQAMGSNTFLGEPADGAWRFVAIDERKGQSLGKLVKWGLVVRGR